VGVFSDGAKTVLVHNDNLLLLASVLRERWQGHVQRERRSMARIGQTYSRGGALHSNTSIHELYFETPGIKQKSLD
jgi:hypothetical protein